MIFIGGILCLKVEKRLICLYVVILKRTPHLRIKIKKKIFGSNCNEASVYIFPCTEMNQSLS